MAKLANAAVFETASYQGLRVRVPSPAPTSLTGFSAGRNARAMAELARKAMEVSNAVEAESLRSKIDTNKIANLTDPLGKK